MKIKKIKIKIKINKIKTKIAIFSKKKIVPRGCLHHDVHGVLDRHNGAVIARDALGLARRTRRVQDVPVFDFFFFLHRDFTKKHFTHTQKKIVQKANDSTMT